MNKTYPDLSRTDKMRFWRAYVEVVQYDLREQKKFLREVVIRTKKRWRSRGWL